jgi:hypothetical protein
MTNHKVIFAAIALLVIGLVASVAVATNRTITVTQATLAPDGYVYVTYRYLIGPSRQMRATAYSYGEWVSALRHNGWNVKEIWNEANY